MPELTIILGGTRHALTFAPGRSAREIIERAGFGVRSGCCGNGACGLCLVRIEAGPVGAPTATERLILQPEQIARGVRLACQIMPEQDLCLRILNPAENPVWQDLPPERLPCMPSGARPTELEPGSLTGAAYGLAIDLGTTQISFSLWDLTRGKRLAARIGPNPQSECGADVVTRLIVAKESLESRERLIRMPLDALREGLAEACSQAGISPREIGQAAFVGNTAMLALLTAAEFELLLRPDYWTRHIECKVEHPESWASALGIHPEALVHVIPPLAGFVGSDLLAGVLATGLTERPGGLLVDFGTNSELALWDGRTLWVTSGAGGPAFENCGSRCGMPAGPGAVCRVRRPPAGEELQVQVIGGGEPRGFCGSGQVDLIACLRRTGELTATGGFASPRHKDGFVLRQAPAVRLTKPDVDLFQRAKAAIGVGLSTLLAKARLKAADLNRVCVSGAFGHFLDVRNAQSIGLLPETALELVELRGNTALAGCERWLLCPGSAGELAAARARAVLVNLSRVDDFDTLFLENLYLEPLKLEER